MSTLNEKILAQMECPVCYSLLRSPIRVCESGHGVCDSCLEKLTNNTCPLCRGQILKTNCHLLESIYYVLTIPCKYSEDGCDFVCNGEEMKIHERKCDFKIEKCSLYNVKCQWTGKRKEMIEHFMEEHNMEYELVHKECPECDWVGSLTVLTAHFVEKHSISKSDQV